MVTVKIILMESSYIIGGKKYLALNIDDIRHGPDAGPWIDIQSFNVDADELIRVANKAKEKG